MLFDRIPVWHQIRAAVGGGSSAQHRLPMVLRIELMTPSQITPHSVRPEHENGSKATLSRKPSMK